MGLLLNYFLIPTFLLFISIRKYHTYKWGRCTNKVKLHKKIAIITGANSGIGYEVAKELSLRGACVIMACRYLNSAANAILKIKEGFPEANLIPMELDLASLKSVKKFADEIKLKYNKIDLLINNAGVAYPKRESRYTSDGFEIHFGTNHLGHFLLTNLLLDELKASIAGRIVIVSSTMHVKGRIVLEDLTIDSYKNIVGYENSKLANMYFCQELAKRLDGTSVRVYALCPGWVHTNLFKHYSWKWFILILPFAFLFMRSQNQGAQTTIYCATEPQLDNESGSMYRNCEKYTSIRKFDPTISSKLWELSEDLTKQIVS